MWKPKGNGSCELSKVTALFFFFAECSIHRVVKKKREYREKKEQVVLQNALKVEAIAQDENRRRNQFWSSWIASLSPFHSFPFVAALNKFSYSSSSVDFLHS